MTQVEFGVALAVNLGASLGNAGASMPEGALANETATDTYGDTDTLRGIEAIDATNEDDVLIGTVSFQGLVGKCRR